MAPWIAGLAVLVALDWVVERPPTGSTPVRVRRDRWALTPVRGAAITIVLTAAVFLWRLPQDRASSDRSLDLVVLWLLSIGALVAAAANEPARQPGSPRQRLADGIRRHRSEVVIIGALLALAAVLRLHDLSGTPWAMSGDEGTFAVTARDAWDGSMVNPFSSGVWGYPSAVFMTQGLFIELLGESVGAARMLSALLGIGSVVSIYFLVRHHLGLATAFTAAALTAAFNYHVFWSRNAQDAVAPMFFVPLALLFLDRGLVGHSRIHSVVAGLVIALAQFFHPANRILFPIAVVYIGYALLNHGDEPSPSWTRRMGEVGQLAAWMTAAVIVGHLPLAAYFWSNPTAFWDRTDQVSVFASGWLEREQEITGHGAVRIMAVQFKNAAMLPFSTVPHGHYKPGAPLVGWPMAVPAAVGVAVVTARLGARRYFGFALAYWAGVVGLALTSGPPETNRYTAAATFLAVFAAVGLVSVARAAIRVVRLPARVVVPIAVLCVASISVWHVHSTFRDSRQISVFSDPNTEVANTMARQAASLGPGLTVYLSGPPRIYYDGFQSVRFIAPLATGIDVDPPWSDHEAPPVLTGPALFVFLPERAEEFETIRRWFPNGEGHKFEGDDGAPLYDSYLVASAD